MAKRFKISPLWQRRWKVFRSHRRGFWSSVVLAALILLSCFANVLCNQRPIMVKHDGEFYFPLAVTYPETTFGGDFETEADYSDPHVQELLEKGEGNWAIYPPIRFDYKDVDLALDVPAPAPPDDRHWLGTDDRGRDVFARLIYGFRLSIFFGITLSLAGVFIAIIVGGLQGYLGGRIDILGQRITELWGSQNELLLLIIMSAIFARSVFAIFCLMLLFSWMGLSAYVRAEFLKARSLTYVQAAVALGSKRGRVMMKHILPNTLTPVITFFPFRIAATITGLTALDFFGLGVPPPEASLGELVAQGKDNLHSWWIILSVFVVLVTLITLLNFVGEGVQKAFDPKVIS